MLWESCARHKANKGWLRQVRQDGEAIYEPLNPQCGFRIGWNRPLDPKIKNHLNNLQEPSVCLTKDNFVRLQSLSSVIKRQNFNVTLRSFSPWVSTEGGLAQGEEGRRGNKEWDLSQTEKASVND